MTYVYVKGRYGIVAVDHNPTAILCQHQPNPMEASMTVTGRTWTIGQLAEEYATTLRTIRFYEDIGLLTPERLGRTRIFHPRDRVRLELILRGKRLGFTLEEIAHVINLYDETPGEAGQLSFLIDDIDKRRTNLQQKRRDLDASLSELDQLEAKCRRDLAQLRT